MSRRALLVAGMVVALLLAGGVSYYASSQPDGLNKVAEERGFNAGEQRHDLEDGTFAGYESSFIDDARLSGGVAGVVGVMVTFLVAGAVVLAVRRRGESRPEDERAEGAERAERASTHRPG